MLAGQLTNVFDAFTIQVVCRALDKLPNQPNSGLGFYAYTNGFTAKDPIYSVMRKLLVEPIEQRLGLSLKLHVGMYLKEQVPWTIHTDYVKQDLDPSIALLIPLNVEPIATHTIVFEQECTTSFADYKTHAVKPSTNAQHLHKDLCSHEDYDDLSWVTLKQAYPWTPGSVIYWDRKLLHSSDNFLSAGVREKSALVMFMTND